MHVWNCEPNPNQYREWTILVNRILFTKEHFNCNRDNMDYEEQHTIELFESMCAYSEKISFR
jgi:hypothetical protein